ncbi:lysophospholipase L1-like esterase [Paenibacillus taihuensis]|uniref:Lysophospholipase L1-like esterase n=1 Tax=Paenibacillus taihuensis TaxID=1156355 RepID=A0A3D9RM39_9BACL|nr:SGNH/GDSL hydrolase family protein [Paenibacillus taihuensis]REE80960.1 lysophospholipase L1-like esterase [Paenibacillus taihuensis]
MTVPAGYFATPVVDTFNAYPHLLHRRLKEQFPFAVANVIVTAIGGEHAVRGAERFERDVLSIRPDVVTIYYALNDRGSGLGAAHAAWCTMIEQSLAVGSKIILLTPTWETSYRDPSSESWKQLCAHREQVVSLAEQYEVGLVDSFGLFAAYASNGSDPSDLLSWSNHPNRRGHELVAGDLLRWFVY